MQLIKHGHDTHAENYKMLIKEIREDLNKWKYHVHELEDST